MTTDADGRGASDLCDQLGPLPEPAFGLLATDGDTGRWTEANKGEPAFDSDQMRAYAAQQVAAERERCAKLCESKSANGNWRADTRHDCAALIRGEMD